jgi:hypothetical protein
VYTSQCLESLVELTALVAQVLSLSLTVIESDSRRANRNLLFMLFALRRLTTMLQDVAAAFFKNIDKPTFDIAVILVFRPPNREQSFLKSLPSVPSLHVMKKQLQKSIRDAPRRCGRVFLRDPFKSLTLPPFLPSFFSSQNFAENGLLTSFVFVRSLPKPRPCRQTSATSPRCKQSQAKSTPRAPVDLGAPQRLLEPRLSLV